MTASDASPARRRNHLLWIGPAVTFAGAVTYFTVFARFPATRDVPWVNLPVVLLGVALSVAGVWRAFARSAVYRGRILGSIGAVLAVLLGGLFVTYVFGLSYMLPEPTALTLGLERGPDFALRDQHGRTVRLADLRGKKVVLTFYRGFW